MTDDQLHRVLIFSESSSDAQRILEQYRAHGHRARTQRFSNGDELSEALDDADWDLMLVDSQQPDAQLEAVVGQAEAQGIPIVVLGEPSDDQGSDLPLSGARDFTTITDPRFVAKTVREMADFRLRRDYEQVRSELQELKARYELLMGGSQEPIAYITDGMHIDANPAYARLFGYADPEELACLPVIDLIAADDQDIFKQFLRNYKRGREDRSELTVRTRQGDDVETVATLRFAPADYEGERCTQVVIVAANQRNADSGASFLQQFEGQLASTGGRRGKGALAYLHIENLPPLRRSIGLIAADEAISDLHQQIAACTSRADVCGQVTADGYGIYFKRGDRETGQAQASRLLDHINNRACRSGALSVEFQCSAALLHLEDFPTERAPELIQRLYNEIQTQLARDVCQGLSTCKPAPEAAGKRRTASSLEALRADNKLRIQFQPMVSLQGHPAEYYEVSAEVLDAQWGRATLSLAQSLLDAKRGSTLDRWVIETVAGQLAEKRAREQRTQLLINVSPCLLQDGDFINWLPTTLTAANIPPGAITLQIEQQAATAALAQTARLCSDIKALGCQISLSRCGDSGEALSTLQQIAADLVKIDEQLISEYQGINVKDSPLPALLKDIAQAGAGAVIPNVVSAAMLASLWPLGASFVQGDYLQAPSLEMDYAFSKIA